MGTQQRLWEQVRAEQSQPRDRGSEPGAPLPPKVKRIERRQSLLVPLDVEALVGLEHKVRAIWELTGKMDLSRFEQRLGSAVGKAGRSSWEPRLLVSIWVYGYSEGISSARQIARQMKWEPGLLWLAGLGVVNHTTLSEFRVQHQRALEGVFAQLLALLEEGGYVDLETVMHDGTKIRAQAGADTFRRQATLRQRLEQARQVVQQMADPQEEEGSQRRRAARQRAAQEKLARLEQAAQELAALQQQRDSEAEQEQVRVSLSEPEARLMKHGDNAIAPSYNLQLSTDAKAGVIVGLHLTQNSSDSGALPEALAQMEQTLGRAPQRLVVDGGYTTAANIEWSEQQQIELIGSLGDPSKRQRAALQACGIDAAFGIEAFRYEPHSRTLQCAAGKTLGYVRQSHKRGRVYEQYQAAGSDCVGCPLQTRCCPRRPARGRLVSRLVQEAPAVAAFRQRMQQPAAQQYYKRRGAVAEFPNAWIKEKLKVRKFRLRGWSKASTEALWAALTYNAMQWIRLQWRPAQATLQAGLNPALFGP
jgi:transposase